jgi:hypothetical protein
MAEFKKYLMQSQNDYRPSENNHEVILVKSTPQGDRAYGRFSIIDEDMIDLTEEEKFELPKRDIPKISLRQCRELLILTDKFDAVESILASLPESTDEEKKAAKEAKPAASSSNEEKSTLGDIDALAELKKRMEEGK